MTGLRAGPDEAVSAHNCGDASRRSASVPRKTGNGCCHCRQHPTKPAISVPPGWRRCRWYTLS